MTTLAVLYEFLRANAALLAGLGLMGWFMAQGWDHASPLARLGKVAAAASATLAWVITPSDTAAAKLIAVGFFAFVIWGLAQAAGTAAREAAGIAGYLRSALLGILAFASLLGLPAYVATARVDALHRQEEQHLAAELHREREKAMHLDRQKASERALAAYLAARTSVISRFCPRPPRRCATFQPAVNDLLGLEQSLGGEVKGGRVTWAKPEAIRRHIEDRDGLAGELAGFADRYGPNRSATAHETPDSALAAATTAATQREEVNKLLSGQLRRALHDLTSVDSLLPIVLEPQRLAIFLSDLLALVGTFLAARRKAT